MWMLADWESLYRDGVRTRKEKERERERERGRYSTLNEEDRNWGKHFPCCRSLGFWQRKNTKSCNPEWKSNYMNGDVYVSLDL